MDGKIRSKTDRWVSALVLGLTAVLAVLCALSIGTFAAYLLFPAAAVILILVWWIYLGTWYEFQKDRLFIRNGPFCRAVPYAEISSAKLSKDPASAPALSIERIALSRTNGRYVTDVILISPPDRDAVLSELKRRCPPV